MTSVLTGAGAFHRRLRRFANGFKAAVHDLHVALLDVVAVLRLVFRIKRREERFERDVVYWLFELNAHFETLTFVTGFNIAAIGACGFWNVILGQPFLCLFLEFAKCFARPLPPFFCCSAKDRANKIECLV